jgi:hypothetical protein
MGHISWIIHRLSKMSVCEIFYRIFQSMKKFFDLIYYRYLSHEVGKMKFDFDLNEIFKLSNNKFKEALPLLEWDLKNLIDESTQILDDTYITFGVKQKHDHEVNWISDPLTNKNWPNNFWTKINIKDSKYYGGPKFVWEINRFHFLNILGISFFISGDIKYGNKMLDLVEDWLEKNPYPYGVNWTSCIEVAIRLINLIYSLSFLENYHFDKNKMAVINKFIYLHANHIYKYPSKYSSGNNHSIAEAFALFVSGLFSKKSFKTSRWIKKGQKILNKEIKKQIFDDGGSIECSVTYLSFVYDFFLIYKILCDRENLQYPEIVNERLRKSAIFIDEIIDVGGNLPNIGDQDSAVAINFGLSNWENFKSILNTASFLFKDLQIKNISQTDIKTYLLTRNSHIKKKKRENSGINFESILFKESGLVVIKDSSKDKEIIFYGNCSPMGMPPLYAHGHLDALSFMLSINGDEIFIDPGTYLYHSGGKWRKYFRSSAAHNTVRINKTDFSTQPGDFMYGRPYKIKYIDFIDNNNETKWISEHDAYRGEPVKGSHKRIFSYLKKSRKFEVTDIIYSAIPNYKVELFFHLHPECSIDIFNNNIHIMRNKNIVILSVDDKLKIKVFNGSEDPIFGWYSKNFNEIERTNTIVCSGFFKGSIKIVNRGSIK